MNIPWSLSLRHVRAHWFRNSLTVGAVAVAVFLFCFLVSLIVTLDAQVEEASQDRLIVQSAVSLFVDLPLDYQTKISGVAGIEHVTKWQWFGGYYQSPDQGFFAQFAVDPKPFFDMYKPDVEITEGPEGSPGNDTWNETLQAMLTEKRGALIGKSLAEKWGWKVGDTIPLNCTIFQKSDGSAWDFVILGIFTKKKANVDENTLFFRFDYLQDTMEASDPDFPIGTGTYFIEAKPGLSAQVIGEVDSLFTNGPQRTKTTTEAAFQQSFVSMLGNLPLFLGTIGGAVVFAVFFSVVNAMMISGRQRIRESGILKALGFRDGVIGTLIVFESLLITLLGGLAGIALAFGSGKGIQKNLQNFFPNFVVEPKTMILGLSIAVIMGVIAGITPMLNLMRLRPTDALRSEG